MRILHVHTRYRERGGEDSVVDAERRLLEQSGLDVATIDFQNPSSAIDSISTFARAPWNRRAVEETLAAARRHRAEVVHIHNTWFALSPAVVPALAAEGFPVVMTFHNYRLVCVNGMLFRDGQPCELCVGGSTLPGVRHRCYRDSFGASSVASVTIQVHRRRETWASGLSVAIALTGFAKDKLLDGGLPPGRTVVKPNFVADPGSRRRPPSESETVLFVGRLSPEKGVGRLIDAWRLAGLDGLQLMVIGTGPLAEELQARTDSRIRFVGSLSSEQVAAEMLSARALVVPSLWYEVQPMVILEGLAAGLPVLHTDLGALAETSGGGGVSLGSGSAADMAKALAALTDDQLVDRAGREGRSEYESRFSEQVSADELMRIYRMAVN